MKISRAVSVLKQRVGVEEEQSNKNVFQVCDFCNLPAVCFGANFVNPKFRCPIHCREHPQIGGVHGRDNYLRGHIESEGVSFE